MNALLLTIMFVPLAAALLLLAGRNVFSREGARFFALVAAVATLVLALVFANQFLQLPVKARTSPVEPRMSVTYHWFTYAAVADESNGRVPLQFDFQFGMDGISLTL